MTDGRPGIWTPDGVKVLGQKLERVEMRARQLEWFVQFSDFAAFHQLGLHCGRCGKDVIGKNGGNDAVFAVACGCREWIGSNRDHHKVN